MNSDKPTEKLKEYGVKQSDAEKLLQDLSEDRIQRIKEGKLDQSKTIRKFFLNNALRNTAVAMAAGETDEPVTCDVKRLIRLPGSLHGKTGFKVEKISPDFLKGFNPLKDAVVLQDNPVKIQINKPMSIEVKGQNYNLKDGEEELPTHLAVFLVGRKMANII
jgi:DNA primase small subunit